MSKYIKITDRDFIFYIKSCNLCNISEENMQSCSEYIINKKTGEVIKNRGGISTELLVDVYLGL